MGRKCVCQVCGNKGNTDIFFKVADSGRNKYYCNRNEYETYMNERNKFTDMMKYIAQEILNLEEKQIVNPFMTKKINTLHQFYDYEVILQCFIENHDAIVYWMNNRQFENETHMISYIMKIIEGNINDVYKVWKYKQRQQVNLQRKEVPAFEDVNISYVKQKEGDSILGFLDEEDY